MHDTKLDISKTLVIHPALKTAQNLSLEARLEEAIGLAYAIDLEVVFSQIVLLNKIIPATFIGSGKVEEFKNIIKELDITLAIIDERITPIQQRNLEKAWGCKVIDRTALILEIFGARAKTNEGKLQVDLAALEYQKSRLVRSWTHLERQRGGFGFLGGPGETQIESDRRMISNQIIKIKKELEKVKNTRTLHRKARKSVPYPVVALVGYTNAGKSTLFNKLTGEQQLAEDMLFATLDPTMRLINLPSRKKIILSDTVGFISELPTELVAAFRATLEEVVEADIILHVRDIAHSYSEQQKKDVLEVLKKIGVEDKILNNQIEILNKIDLLGEEEQKNIIERSSENNIAISALNGKNIDSLLKKIDEFLARNEEIIKITLPTSNGKTLAWIYQNSTILSRKENETEIDLQISISQKNKSLLQNLLSTN